MDIQRVINKAKLNLMTKPNTTFFSALLANLRLHLDETYPTAATDGIGLWINPGFAQELNDKELLGLLLHEVLHVGFQHMDRCNSAGLEQDIYNEAADYTINNFIDNRGFILPKEALINHDWDKLSTRQIYDLIKDQPRSNIPMDVILSEDGNPGESKNGASQAEKRETVITNIVKAVTQAKLSNDYGSVPGEIARLVKELCEPKVPWQSLLHNFAFDFAKNDYSWSRPNKRYWPEFYLPRLHNQEVRQITVAIDVSGSINQMQVDEFMAEIRYIWDILNPSKLRLMFFDIRITVDKTFEEGDSIDNLQIFGGGGTHIGPVIETLIEDDPDFAIILTDGEFSMPYLKSVETQLLWVINNKNKDFIFQPSKGVVIQYGQ